MTIRVMRTSVAVLVVLALLGVGGAAGPTSEVRLPAFSSSESVEAMAWPRRGAAAGRDGGTPDTTSTLGEVPGKPHTAFAIAAAFGQQPPQPQQQEEFVPIDELPPQDQLAAAPLLVAAYAFVVLALFAYVLSVSRRLGVVQREIERLESDLKRGGRT